MTWLAGRISKHFITYFSLFCKIELLVHANPTDISSSPRGWWEIRPFTCVSLWFSEKLLLIMSVTLRASTRSRFRIIVYVSLNWDCSTVGFPWHRRKYHTLMPSLCALQHLAPFHLNHRLALVNSLIADSWAIFKSMPYIQTNKMRTGFKIWQIIGHNYMYTSWLFMLIQCNQMGEMKLTYSRDPIAHDNILCIITASAVVAMMPMT